MRLRCSDFSILWSECTVKWLYRDVIVPWSDCTVKWLYSEVIVLWRIVLWSDCMLLASTAGFSSTFEGFCAHTVQNTTQDVLVSVVLLSLWAWLLYFGQMNFFGCGCASLWRVGGCPLTALRSLVLSFIQAIDWGLAVVWLSCCWLLKCWARKEEWSGGWAEQSLIFRPDRKNLRT